MKLFTPPTPSPTDSPLHLTYCLNIHPGETWEENLAAISNYALRVRDAVLSDGKGQKEFGLGLRLSCIAAQQLADPATLEDFRRFLADNGLYVFTINGFPYGPFHGTAVKADVYRPDWRTPERRDYTIQLIDILAALLPDGVSGSISTVPGSYADWIRTPADVAAMAAMLAETACLAATVLDHTGRDICIALEPEPDCFIETTAQAARFITRTLPESANVVTDRLQCTDARARAILAHHIGLCLDTAHLAVQFEDLTDSLSLIASAGVRLAKVQLSAALRLTPTGAALDRLRTFIDPVYLHQTKALHPDGRLQTFPDLPQALAAFDGAVPTGAELRVHFHVPMFFTESDGLSSTSSLLTPSVWPLLAAATEHWEIETYTFDVLPENLRPPDVIQSTVREYEWVLANLGDSYLN